MTKITSYFSKSATAKATSAASRSRRTGRGAKRVSSSSSSSSLLSLGGDDGDGRKSAVLAEKKENTRIENCPSKEVGAKVSSNGKRNATAATPKTYLDKLLFAYDSLYEENCAQVALIGVSRQAIVNFMKTKLSAKSAAAIRKAFDAARKKGTLVPMNKGVRFLRKEQAMEAESMKEKENESDTVSDYEDDEAATAAATDGEQDKPEDAETGGRATRRRRKVSYRMEEYYFGSSADEASGSGTEEEEEDADNNEEDDFEAEGNDDASEPEISSYEKQRLEQIKENQEMLRALGIVQAQSNLSRAAAREKKRAASKRKKEESQRQRRKVRKAMGEDADDSDFRMTSSEEEDDDSDYDGGSRPKRRRNASTKRSARLRGLAIPQGVHLKEGCQIAQEANGALGVIVSIQEDFIDVDVSKGSFLAGDAVLCNGEFLGKPASVTQRGSSTSAKGINQSWRAHMRDNDIQVNASDVPGLVVKGGAKLLSLGNVFIGSEDQSVLSRFWSRRGGKFSHPFPIGYESEKTHFGGRVYRSSIKLSEDGKAPVFEVRELGDDDSKVVFQGKTCTEPWTKICIAKKTKARISGPLFFGFSDVRTLKLISQLPNFNALEAALDR